MNAKMTTTRSARKATRRTVDGEATLRGLKALARRRERHANNQALRGGNFEWTPNRVGAGDVN
jgi:hypothetical protein